VDSVFPSPWPGSSLKKRGRCTLFSSRSFIKLFMKNWTERCTLKACYRRVTGKHKFRFYLKRYGHHSGCSPDDKCSLRSFEHSDCGFKTQTGTYISPYFILSMYSCVIGVLAKPRYSSNKFKQISTLFKNSNVITKPRKDRRPNPQKRADKICMQEHSWRDCFV
jgi:hypothetical protein